ncbi:uncharacterized protein CEXT_361561 [Caerostris extrusa]|uniref:Uncharacterized protein n=1 Tax=Caerostris extrusa TaxID=172846 RepID=A0AAV4WIX2_CAEEX|nr:uncharacterized protein CEXT_361561 [Caerostris extrusa]
MKVGRSLQKIIKKFEETDFCSEIWQREEINCFYAISCTVIHTKITHVQELLPADLPVRHTFALEFLARMEMDNDGQWNILWTDEAQFSFQDFVNTQFCKGNCGVQVDDIVYCRAIFFEEVSSAGLVNGKQAKMVNGKW